MWRGIIIVISSSTTKWLQLLQPHSRGGGAMGLGIVEYDAAGQFRLGRRSGE